ncbi:EamA-like_transporter family protein [Hexamita inflata]|uniref:EamA-like transporter family protein n=1 Tax=Hexamita inflata TaxID=28002 RepID=A0AA86PLY0_9EUKA|nr:EamA-like transporter family protein [Hexamita inflata]
MSETKVFPKAFQALIITGMLSFGTINTVVKKIMYQTDGKNIDGGMEPYAKPWWCTLIMFMGEAMCLVAYYCIKASRKGVYAPDDKYIRQDPTGGMGYKNFLLLVLLLSTCDLLQTTLTGIGLLYCPASITQILRGFLIVFVLGSARIFLKRIPKTFHLFGVCSALVGLIFVGINALLNAKNENSGIGGIVLGICLTLTAQVFSSIQFVFEEKFMKGKYDIPSLYLVGFEGIFGMLLCICVFLPAVYFIPGKDHGSYENFINSAYMMFNNPLLLGLQVLYFVSISFFNFMALTISKMLSATHRALIDALRTASVWVVMVIIYYATLKSKPAHDNKPYGEELNWYSFIEAFGFVCMIFGTLVHNNVGGFGLKVMAIFKIGEGEVECCKCEKKYHQIGADEEDLLTTSEK